MRIRTWRNTDENEVIEVYKSLISHYPNLNTTKIIFKTAEICCMDSNRVLKILLKDYNKIKNLRKLISI